MVVHSKIYPLLILCALSAHVDISAITYAMLPPHQLNTLQELFLKSFYYAYNPFTLKELEETNPKWLEELFAHECASLSPSTLIITALEHTTPVGFIECSLDNQSTLSIHLIAVDPDWLGKGIGKSLIHQACQKFPEAKTLVVASRVLNKNAHAFYKKLGFNTTSHALDHYDPKKYSFFIKSLI